MSLRNLIKGLVIVLVIGIIGAVGWLVQQGSATTTESVTRQVTDSTGAVVDIPAHPKRVVFLNVSNLDLYFAAGGQETVVGRPTSHSMTPELAQAVADIPKVGIIHSPNVEQILALHPDLVIGVNVPFHNKLRDTLAQNNIPLYINSLTTAEDTMTTLQFFGELTGKTEQAKEKAAAIQQECEEAVAATEGKQSPKMLILFSQPDSANMATAKSFSGDLLKRLGGTNLADIEEDAPEGSYVPLSMEYVLRNDPEVIGIISMGQSKENEEQFLQNMKQDPVWQQTKAVQQDRVYALPAELFTVNPGSHIGSAMMYLSQILYGGQP